MKPPPCFDEPETRRKIEDICAQNSIDVKLLMELCEVIQSYSGSGRKEGVMSDITGCIDTFLDRSSEKR